MDEGKTVSSKCVHCTKKIQNTHTQGIIRDNKVNSISNGPASIYLKLLNAKMLWNGTNAIIILCHVGMFRLISSFLRLFSSCVNIIFLWASEHTCMCAHVYVKMGEWTCSRFIKIMILYHSWVWFLSIDTGICTNFWHMHARRTYIWFFHRNTRRRFYLIAAHNLPDVASWPAEKFI